VLSVHFDGLLYILLLLFNTWFSCYFSHESNIKIDKIYLFIHRHHKRTYAHEENDKQLFLILKLKLAQQNWHSTTDHVCMSYMWYCVHMVFCAWLYVWCCFHVLLCTCCTCGAMYIWFCVHDCKCGAVTCGIVYKLYRWCIVHVALCTCCVGGAMYMWCCAHVV